MSSFSYYKQYHAPTYAKVLNRNDLTDMKELATDMIKNKITNTAPFEIMLVHLSGQVNNPLAIIRRTIDIFVTI